MVYNLSNYILAVQPNDADLLSMFGTISIGGEGSQVGSISARRTNNMFDVSGFSTGGYVVNKNLSRVGEISVSINQTAPNVGKLIKLFKAYQSNNYEGCTLTLSDLSGNKVISGIDCYLSIPEQAFGSSSAEQTWTFACGQVNFE